MDWWFRFHMGLPPRPEDLRELRRIAPELFSRHRLNRQIDRYSYPQIEHEWILNWIASSEGYSDYRIVDAQNCPRPRCPLKEHPTGGNPQDKDSAEIRIDLMSLGGGKKEPLGVFLDAVRRVHARKGAVTAFIVTDGYIFTPESEHATPGGFGNFLQYLDVFELIEGSTLTIFLPPDAHGAGKQGQINWTRAVSEHVKRRKATVTLRPFRAGSHFHDRFYLAQHKSGELAGVFGPSMNGLSDNDFVLVGELEENVIARLKTYLRM